MEITHLHAKLQKQPNNHDIFYSKGSVIWYLDVGLTCILMIGKLPMQKNVKLCRDLVIRSIKSLRYGISISFWKYPWNKSTQLSKWSYLATLASQSNNLFRSPNTQAI